ncbi:type-F conjugative transfer system protein TraW [Rickettsiaceae bacterium]|nr:type-F conjugative transfer system protein TraW [Rickettsiaceae bacterium]
MRASIFFVIAIAMTATVTAATSSACDAKGDKAIQTKPSPVIQDFGTRGNVFPIEEESLLVEIMRKLRIAKEDGSLEKLQNEFTKKVKEKILRPNPVSNIKRARENRSWTYDPTYRQEEDITDGRGNLIVQAGTTVNALDTISWGEPLIFIDGDDDEQVAWAKKQRGKITLTKGAPLELAKNIDRRVYFDQGGILCAKFKIESVPATIEQDGTKLLISEVRI